jgi:smad nuclear-interacting protein 1
VLKYHEPSEARKPPASQDWRLFVFKGSAEVEPPIPLGVQSCWLFGREKAVVDVVVEHPSASKQHAVIQFRAVQKRGEEDALGVSGTAPKKVVKPYVIDLDSSNGTWLNGERIGARRFVEARSGDVVKIGTSEREYVFMLPPKE